MADATGDFGDNDQDFAAAITAIEQVKTMLNDNALLNNNDSNNLRK